MKTNKSKTLLFCLIIGLWMISLPGCTASEDPGYYVEPPLVKTRQHYVELSDWGQTAIDGRPTGSHFSYAVYTSEGTLIQEIKLECKGDDLYFPDWTVVRDLMLDSPKTLVDLKDLNGDFHDDLKILVKNKDGEMVYQVYLWDEQIQSFVLSEYPSWSVQNRWRLAGGAGCLILLAVSVYIRRKVKGRQKDTAAPQQEVEEDRQDTETPPLS